MKVSPMSAATVASVTIVLPASEHGVRNVAAIELADRKQVERGGEQAEPGGERHRMHVDGVALRQRAVEKIRNRLEEQRFAQFHESPCVGRQRCDRDRLMPTSSTGMATRKPAIGPAIPMSNSSRFAGNRLPNPDEGAKRPGERQRRRQEVGQRRVDPVVAAREVVPELVRAEDRQDRRAVPEAVEEISSHVPVRCRRGAEVDVEAR